VVDALKQLEERTAPLRDPELPIHHKLAEQDLIRSTPNRRLRLFGGNSHGGGTAPIPSGRAVTCHRQRVDPQRHLSQMLVDLPGMLEAERARVDGVMGTDTYRESPLAC
jgi:hypothetical protein